jgi:thiol:disulfide interchange protein DsbC
MKALWTWIGWGLVGGLLPIVEIERAHAAETSQESALIDSAREQLTATFTNFQFEKIEPSQIPGIVEIYANGRIIYFAPAQQILIMGELYSANGVSLTEERVSAFASEKSKGVDRSVALVVGEGDREVIEFLDPDCGHCRAAHKWFAESKPEGVKRLIYFMPRKGRAQSEARVLELLCSKPEDREAALERVFNPKAPVDLQKAIRCREGAEQLAAQVKVAEQVGVYATPFFIIDGKATAGFNAEQMAESLLKPAETVSQAR